jgi:hypothetical protein
MSFFLSLLPEKSGPRERIGVRIKKDRVPLPTRIFISKAACSQQSSAGSFHRSVFKESMFKGVHTRISLREMRHLIPSGVFSMQSRTIP